MIRGIHTLPNEGNAGHGSVLVAYGELDAAMIGLAADSEAIKGRMVYLNNRR